MKNRKALPFLLVAFALMVSTSAFAAEAPTLPASEADFLESLQAPVAPEQSPSLNPQGPANPTPIFQHGWDCTYVGTRYCVPCATGKRMNCDDYRCNYNGTWHTDSVCGTCANYC